MSNLVAALEIHVLNASTAAGCTLRELNRVLRQVFVCPTCKGRGYKLP